MEDYIPTTVSSTSEGISPPASPCGNTQENKTASPPQKTNPLTPEEDLLLDYLIDSAIESIQQERLKNIAKSSNVEGKDG